jgi:hypothetical protein
MHLLVLGRCSDVAVHGQVRQECFDLRFSGEEVLARPHAMKTDELHDPLHRGALSVNRVAIETEHLSNFIKEFGWLTARRVRHIRFP